jgi:hypothetical protein
MQVAMYASQQVYYKLHLPSLLFRPPRVQSLLGARCFGLASLAHQLPRPVPDDTLHHPLVPYQRSQSLCPSFSREVPRTVRIQPLVDYPLACPGIFHLSEHMVGVVRVGRSRYSSTVVQHITATLPAGEENAVFEFRARLSVYRPPSYGSRLALLCRRWVKGSCARCDECVQVLVDCIVDSRSGYAEEVYMDDSCMSVSSRIIVSCAFSVAYL